MQSRFGKGLLCFCVAALAVLLLSNLVEGPPALAEPLAPVTHAALVSLGPALPEPLTGEQTAPAACRPLAPPTANPACPFALSCAPCRDANGRVLTAGSYLKSVYPLFRSTQTAP